MKFLYKNAIKMNHVIQYYESYWFTLKESIHSLKRNFSYSSIKFNSKRSYRILFLHPICNEIAVATFPTYLLDSQD